MKYYRVTHDLTIFDDNISEHKPLIIKKGYVVYQFDQHNFNVPGTTTVTLSHDGSNPFFMIANEYLRDENGKGPNI